MSDNATLVVVFIVACALLVFITWRFGVGSAPPKGAEAEPICGCGHHLAFHTLEGVCKEQVKTLMRTNPHGFPEYEVFDCTCQEYVGPVPAVSPQIVRELSKPFPATEPYSQDK